MLKLRLWTRLIRFRADLSSCRIPAESAPAIVAGCFGARKVTQAASMPRLCLKEFRGFNVEQASLARNAR